jgi:hypothetical protein
MAFRHEFEGRLWLSPRVAECFDALDEYVSEVWVISRLFLKTSGFSRFAPRLAVLFALAIVSGTFLFSGSASAKSKSYVCNHPDAPGGWGALDLGCDADQFGDLSRIRLSRRKNI